jgi:hypothetical protein
MSEYGELVHAYVAAGDVVQTLSDAGMPEQECIAAAQGVQRERAQWVVDNIAIEMGRRATILSARDAELSNEQLAIRNDLALISETYRPSVSSHDSERLIGLYDKQLSYDSVLDIAQSQPPFVLKMQTRDVNFGIEGFTASPSLYKWVKSSHDALVETYGKRITQGVSKSARILDNELRIDKLADISELEGSVEFTDVSGAPELHVKNPVKVMDYLLGRNNSFGYKSMISVLCLAAFQANLDAAEKK